MTKIKINISRIKEIQYADLANLVQNINSAKELIKDVNLPFDSSDIENALDNIVCAEDNLKDYRDILKATIDFCEGQEHDVVSQLDMIDNIVIE